MGNLSTEELFHFTKFDRLLKIIEFGFYPRYNLEHTFLSNFFNRPSALARIPMVCFCDIPLDKVKNHTLKYGNYAIGLEKSWGEKYGLNPVIYIHKNSQIANSICAMSNSFEGYHSSIVEGSRKKQIYLMISGLAAGVNMLNFYMKQYERVNDEVYMIGDKNYKFPKGRFYDEREWRFVPNNNLEESWIISLSLDVDEKYLSDANESIKRYALKFDFCDIRYLVYNRIEEKEILINAIQNRFKKTREEVNLQITFQKIE